MPLYTSIGGAFYFVGAGPTPPPVINYYIYSAGINTNGGLGDNSIVSRSSPVQVSSSISWKTLTTNYLSSGGIKNDGTLWDWGLNSSGELGIGNTLNRSSPVQVAGSWSQIEQGYQMAFGIRNDGTLWAWGNNNSGFLGVGNRTTTYYSSPVQIGADTWLEIRSGGGANTNYTFGLKSDYTLWAWGVNTVGQLGLNDRINRSSPVQVGTNIWDHVPALGAGGSTVVGVASDQTLQTWGHNASGQLGLGDTISRSSPTQVGADLWGGAAVTINNGFGIKTDGTMWGWGLNTGGQIGAPTPTNVTFTWTSIAVMSGPRNGGAPAYHAIRSDGTLWAWGYNTYGQLGLGDRANRSSPSQVGSNTNWSILYQGQPPAVGGAITTDGRLYMWGDNANGQLGQSDRVIRSSPVQVAGSWTQISGGSIGLQVGGTLWSWGISSWGNGDGSTVVRSSPVQVGTSTYNYITSDGGNNFYVINSIGKLFSWGYNVQGSLGDNTNVNKSSMVAVLAVSSFSLVSAGELNALAITTTGKLYAWGYDTFGQLGLPNSNSVALFRRSSPTQVGASSWTFVSIGGPTTMGVKLDGTLWAWGSDASGQFGNGTPTTGIFRSSPVQVQSGTTWTKFLVSGYTGDPLVGVSTIPVIGIKGGQLFAWGYGNGYTLPFNNTASVSRSSPVQVPTAGGTTYSYINASSPVQIGSDAKWFEISGGDSHAVAIDNTLTLYGWGLNSNGQLGQSDTVFRSSPVQIATNITQSNTGYYTWYDFRAGAATTIYGRSTP